MSAMGVAKFERFFRSAARLEVGKENLQRFVDFTSQKSGKFFLRDQTTVKANGRDIVAPFDLPITNGLQERIHDFERSDEQV